MIDSINFDTKNIINNVDMINEDQTDLFAYPKITVPTADNLNSSSVDVALASISACLSKIEQTTHKLQNEITKRPTRFEAMGHLLTKFLMKNQPQEHMHDDYSQDEPKVSKADLEKQQQLLDNLRKNIVTNTDNKVSDIKNTIINVHDSINNITKDCNSRLSAFETKLTDLSNDCISSIEILKKYLVRENKKNISKRVLKQWILQSRHNRNKLAKLNNIICVNKIKREKRIVFQKWFNIAKNEKTIELFDNQEFVKHNLETCLLKIEDLNNKTDHLIENKLDIDEFSKVMKQVDIEQMKQQSDEIKDLVYLQKGDMEKAFNAKIIHNTENIDKLQTQLSTLSSKDDTYSLYKTITELKQHFSQMQNELEVQRESYSLTTHEINLSLNDKYNFLNTKLELFKHELSKLWDQEEGIGKDLFKLQSQSSINPKSMSRKNLADSTNSLRDKITTKYKANASSVSNTRIKFEHSLPMSDSASRIDRYLPNPNEFNNSNSPKQGRKEKNLVLIDLMDEKNPRSIEGVSSFINMEDVIQDGRKENEKGGLSRELARRGARAESQLQGKRAGAKKLNKSQNGEWEHPMSWNNANLKFRKNSIGFNNAYYRHESNNSKN